MLGLDSWLVSLIGLNKENELRHIQITVDTFIRLTAAGFPILLLLFSQV